MSDFEHSFGEAVYKASDWLRQASIKSLKMGVFATTAGGFVGIEAGRPLESTVCFTVTVLGELVVRHIEGSPPPPAKTVTDTPVMGLGVT